MFSLASGLYTEYFSPQQINLLVVGVQGSGKTTTLERIKVTNFATQSVATLLSISNINRNERFVLDDTAIAAAAAAAAVTAAQSSKELKNSNRNSQSDDHHHHNHTAATAQRHSKNTIGPTPELLRSKIFLTDTVDDYQAPTTKLLRRKKRSNNTNIGSTSYTTTTTTSTAGHHVSRFGWICPPPPKFSLLQSQHVSRIDTSNRSSNSKIRDSVYNNENDEFSNEDFDPLMADDHQQFWDDDDDDNDDDRSNTDRNNDDDAMDTTMLSTTTVSARSRRAASTATSTTTNNMTSSSSKNKSGAGTSNSSIQHNGGGPLGLPPPRRITSSYSNGDDLRKSSMESIDLNDRQRYTSQQQKQPKSFLEDDIDYMNGQQLLAIEQYDVKPNSKMLPLEKIRPTIGMNLSKNEICGAKVHVWDLGGKLQDLWERYYDDADAVLFVWRLNRQDVPNAQQQQADDEQGEDVVRVTAEQQMKVLEQVRASVPDDIPFCLLGNIFQVVPPYNCEPDVLYSTNHILPHYHNPLQSLFIGNAVTGQGIKTAIEWLISTAKRQQRIRKRVTDV